MALPFSLPFSLPPMSANETLLLRDFCFFRAKKVARKKVVRKMQAPHPDSFCHFLKEKEIIYFAAEGGRIKIEFTFRCLGK